MEAGAQFANRRHGLPEVSAVGSSYYKTGLNRGYDQVKAGVRAGVVARMRLTGKWSLHSGLHFNTKGFRELSVRSYGLLNNGNSIYFFADYHTTLYYVDLPLQLSYRFGNSEGGAGFRVSGGPYLSWLAAATERIKPNNQPAASGAIQWPEQRHKLSIGYREGDPDHKGQIHDRDDYRPLDFGLQAGAAYEFRSGLYLSAQGQLGLANIVNGHVHYDHTFYPMKPTGFARNRSVSFTAGYYFPSKKR